MKKGGVTWVLIRLVLGALVILITLVILPGRVAKAGTIFDKFIDWVMEPFFKWEFFGWRRECDISGKTPALSKSTVDPEEEITVSMSDLPEKCNGKRGYIYFAMPTLHKLCSSAVTVTDNKIEGVCDVPDKEEIKNSGGPKNTAILIELVEDTEVVSSTSTSIEFWHEDRVCCYVEGVYGWVSPKDCRSIQDQSRCENIPISAGGGNCMDHCGWLGWLEGYWYEGEKICTCWDKP